MKCEAEHCIQLQLRKTEAPFIGHVASGDSLKIHTDKLHAIIEMPEPEDVMAVQRLIGMVTHLTKFVLGLTELTVPLHELAHQDTVGVGTHTEGSIQEDQRCSLQCTCTKVLKSGG